MNAAKKAPRANPFVGLRPFRRNEAVLFFGRREQTVELLERLHRHRFIGVVGSSGCGKSSLVRAGLIPKLDAGMLVEDRTAWLVADMRPGAHPRQSLLQALLQALPEEHHTKDIESLETEVLSAGASAIVDLLEQTLDEAQANLLLIVDQFEEVFRFEDRVRNRQGKDEAADFVRLMLALAEQRALPIYVVMTMRSDFLGDCDAFRGLPEALNRGQYLVPRLTRRQRREAIEGPVRLFGGEIEGRLVDRLLNEAGDESDQLPVLQHALMRLWDHNRNAGLLDVDGYEAIGTLREALSQHAEEALEGMDDERLKLTETIFRTLTLTDDNNRRIRRPVPLATIMAETGGDRGDIVNIIDAFRRTDRSFLTPPAGYGLEDGTVIDISHESLIRQWRRLRDWVDDEADSAATYKRLADAAKRHAEKDDEGRSKVDLLGERGLQAAEEWQEKTAPTEAWTERYGGGYRETLAYLDESRREQKRKLDEERIRQRELEYARKRERDALREQAAASDRQARQARRFGLAMVAVLVLVSVLAGLAIWQWWQARESTFASNYNLAKVLETKATTSLTEAIDKDSTSAYRLAWLYTLSALSQDIGSSRRLPLSQGRVILPELVDITSREAWRSPEPSAPVWSVAFSPDGKSIASGLADHSVRLWNLENGKEIARLQGHKAPVWSVAFSPDGRTVASGSDDHSVRLWNLENGKEIARLQGHKAPVRSVAFSPDGKSIASGSSDQSVRLWNLENGKEIARFEGHKAPVRSVAFSPDGNTIATGSSDQSVRVWELENGKEIARLEGHAAPVQSVAFSPDGNTIASGSRDQSLRLWNFENGKEIARLGGHTAPVLSVAFSPDGKSIASGSLDQSVRLWNLENGKEIARLEGHAAPVQSVAFSPDGSTIASGSLDQNVRLWNVKDGQEIARFEGHPAPVSGVGFSPDGNTIFAWGSADQGLRLWNLENGKEIARLEGHTIKIWSVDFSPDGNAIALGSDDQSVQLWNLENGEEIARFEGHAAPIRSAALSPDGNTIALGSDDQSLRLWNLENGKEVARFEGHTVPILSVAFSPDGKSIALGSSDQSVRLWNVKDGQEIARLARYTDWILSVAFSPDGNTITTGSSDQSVRLWNLENGKEIARLEGHTASVRAVAFSPDSNTIATGSSDQSVRLWNVKDGQEIARLEGHTAPVQSVAFSPDGNTIASGSSDQSVRLWNAENGKETARLEGHTGSVWSVAFSPDGNIITSGSEDQSVRLWDVENGKEIASLEGHTAPIRSVAFSPDGKSIASGSEDQSIRLWNLENGKEITRLEGHAAGIWSVAFSPDGKSIASGSSDYQGIRFWCLAHLEYFDQNGQRAPTFDAIYEASLYLLGYRLDGLEFVPEPRPLYLSPVGDYEFPKRRKYWKLDQPRPPGKDPMEWMVEAMEASDP